MPTLPLITHIGPLSRVIRKRLAQTPLFDELDPPVGALDLKLEKYTMHGATMTFVDPRDGVQYELLLRPTPLHDYIPTEPLSIAPRAQTPLELEA